jgi:hypothetical protein
MTAVAKQKGLYKPNGLPNFAAARRWIKNADDGFDCKFQKIFCPKFEDHQRPGNRIGELKVADSRILDPFCGDHGRVMSIRFKAHRPFLMMSRQIRYLSMAANNPPMPNGK